MKNWWISLSTFWKVILIAAVIVVSVFIFDRFTGAISNYESWANNKAYIERMEKVESLEKENDILRAEKRELEKQAIASKSREAIFAEREKNLDIKTKQELAKLEEELLKQEKEEAVTAQPIDNFTRCERTKQKMIDRNILSAKEINCEVYK